MEPKRRFLSRLGGEEPFSERFSVGNGSIMLIVFLVR